MSAGVTARSRERDFKKSAAKKNIEISSKEGRPSFSVSKPVSFTDLPEPFSF